MEGAGAFMPLRLMTNLFNNRFVTGHGFSRAAKAN
jgi:hypothetical protein